jgi:hypothetical protein
LGNCLEVHGNKKGLDSHIGRGGSSLTARMARTNHDNIILLEHAAKIKKNSGLFA